MDYEAEKDFNSDEDNSEDRYLVLELSEQGYAIPIKYVEEIISHQGFTPIPETKNFILGALNLRGKVIVVLDVRQKLSLEKREPDDQTCIVVIKLKDAILGIMVDRVREVLDITSSQITSSMCETEKEYVDNVAKINDECIFTIDLNQLIFDENPVCNQELEANCE
jgi:purine-binding chemotaxis protein CheW